MDLPISTLPVLNQERTEFGYPRTKCACTICATNCKFIPGFLIPSDLARMCPDMSDISKVLVWAKNNLLASPGALVMAKGEAFRIPTLVLAKKLDGSCIHLGPEDRCGIHAISPFGCAYFDCGPERGNLSKHGLGAVLQAWNNVELYAAIWIYLESIGKVQTSPEDNRRRMHAYLKSKGLL